MTDRAKPSATHYRVVWKREGLSPKAKRYVHRKSADRLINILTSQEPWKFYVRPKTGSEYACCSGLECACGGVTVKEESEARSKDMPKLEWTRLEKRKVTAWEPA